MGGDGAERQGGEGRGGGVNYNLICVFKGSFGPLGTLQTLIISIYIDNSSQTAIYCGQNLFYQLENELQTFCSDLEHPDSCF